MKVLSTLALKGVLEQFQADFERALSDAEKKALKEGLKPLEALPAGAPCVIVPAK